jgi:poly(hydroxyalkanoate) depolymerase family esterase
VRTVLGVALICGLLGSPAAVHAAKDPPDPGQTTTGTVASNGNEYSFIRYVPHSLSHRTRAPLLVMVHGAQTTAEQELHATGFNRIAEREGFVVLYPDVDAVGRSAPGPLNQSWEFYDPSAYFRGHGDAEAIAAMTRDTMAHVPTDPERVYVVGVSAGGLMEAVEAAAYSDLFAAAGSVESAGYADGFCFTDGVGIPVEASAQLAFAQMGERARVVPTMVITSDGDLAFPHTCGEKALQQGLRMNNLVLSGSQDAPLKLTPANVRHDHVPGGYAYDVSSFRDPDGCLVAEQWLIHGMPHSWPGGPTTDPKFAGYTDRKAPSGAEATWAFVRRYTKNGTSLPCAETPVPSVPSVPPAASARCPARWVTLRLPPGARPRRATVDGRRARFKRTRAAVRVRVPATSRPRKKVVVIARAKSGRALTLRRTFKRC